LLVINNVGADYIGLDEVSRSLRGWKLTVFDGVMRVPLFIKWPRKWPQPKPWQSSHCRALSLGDWKP